MTKGITNERYKHIMDCIKSESQKDVCLEMVSIGMYEELNAQVLILIDACIKSSNEWIRNAAFLCLYHQYVRNRDDVCNEKYIKYILNGLGDDSIIVRNTIEEIISEIEEFSPKIYEKVFGVHKGKL